jgi:hypothetical protein
VIVSSGAAALQAVPNEALERRIGALPGAPIRDRLPDNIFVD